MGLGEAGLPELERAMERAWNSAPELERVLNALLGHTGAKAARLERKLERRLYRLQLGVRDDDADRLVQSLSSRLEEATARAALAEDRVLALESEARVLRSRSQRQAARSGDGLAHLWRAVGLDPGAPPFVLHAARKAFRKELHPDRFMNSPPAERKRAEERFKEIDQVFERLLNR